MKSMYISLVLSCSFALCLGDDLPLLHQAARDNNVEQIRILLEQGEDPKSKDYFENTPLHYAIAYGHSDVVRALLNVSDLNQVNVFQQSARSLGIEGGNFKTRIQDGFDEITATVVVTPSTGLRNIILQHDEESYRARMPILSNCLDLPPDLIWMVLRYMVGSIPNGLKIVHQKM